MPETKFEPPERHIDRARNAASSTFFERGMIDRLVTGVRNLFSPSRPPAVQPGHEPWFGPGKPLDPVAPRDDVVGRAFDFPVAHNLNTRPRSYEPVSFAQLRSISDPGMGGYDLLRLAIETRKDQMAKLDWSILPKKQPNEQFRRKSDQRCAELEAFLRRPDKVLHWDEWIRKLIEEQLVIDAPTIYLRKDQGGKPWALEIIDGATITPLLDASGRRPIAPDPAYVQVLKGLPAVHYTSDELIYAPRNPRAHKVYGFSPVEQIIMTVNIGLRREITQLEHYTSGNVPEALIGVPPTWTPQQIKEYQQYWDMLMETPAMRRKAKFVPGGTSFQLTRNEAGQMDPFDEWLARVICYTFSLPPLPFVRMQNRATAQTSYETALEEGLAPMMSWLKNIMDDIIGDWFLEPEYEFVWDNIRKLNQAEQVNLNITLMQRGIMSMDEVRADMGLEPLGLEHVVYGVGPLGFMSVKDMQRAISQGLTMPPNPAMAPEGVDPLTGQPIPGGPEADSDPLDGVPPDLLASVGLDEGGNLMEDVGEPGEAPQDDPIDRVAAHPMIAQTLREVESMHGARR